VSTWAEMDTSRQVPAVIADKSESLARPAAARSIAEKRRIVEETLVEGTSVARVARRMASTRTRYLAGVGSTWEEDLGAQAGHDVAAGSGERECAGASAGGAWVGRVATFSQRAMIMRLVSQL